MSPTYRYNTWMATFKAVLIGLAVIGAVLVLASPSSAEHPVTRYERIVINSTNQACIGLPWILNGVKYSDSLTTEDFQTFLRSNGLNYRGTAEKGSEMWNRMEELLTSNLAASRRAVVVSLYDSYRFVDFFTSKTSLKYHSARIIVWGDYEVNGETRTCALGFGEVDADAMGLSNPIEDGNG